MDIVCRYSTSKPAFYRNISEMITRVQTDRNEKQNAVIAQKRLSPLKDIFYDNIAIETFNYNTGKSNFYRLNCAKKRGETKICSLCSEVSITWDLDISIVISKFWLPKIFCKLIPRKKCN